LPYSSLAFQVAVVSVVGAFRTGKSFLLSFFLRYLHAEQHGPTQSLDWLKLGGEALREGNANLGVASGDSVEVPMSFQWRGGQQRMTTGIWLWSEPFVRRAANGEEVAVLVVDTQGMFDNETSMGLTACIFGLSTLISSHQIYNVEKRIQVSQLVCCSADSIIALPATLLLPRHAIASSS
jgi:atlastin